ncbi:hypothetical protein [Mycobacterium sp. DL99]|uniref:hypothetical protein n=1 Tax=Mycobacterium sp. DL99 TaxID=2528957 RepID=UPI001081602A|nr:hypothetical protein [Mycobacterium sp. DL99]
MPFMPAEPIIQPTYQSMQFGGTASQAAEIVYAIDSGLAGNLLVRGSAEGFREGETVHWRIRLQRPDGSPEMVADPGAWIVVVSTGAIRVLADAEYRAEFNVPQGV